MRQNNEQMLLIHASKSGRSEKCTTFKQGKHRKLIGCVHDTGDGRLIGLTSQGYSQRKLCGFFGTGGYCHKRGWEEMKHL